MFDGNHSPVYLSEVLKRTCQISNFQGRRLELELYIKPQLSGGSMSWVEGVGYLASLLVFSSFFTKTMIPLRTIAIVSNVVFIIYGFFGHLNPTLILHILLLPLNVLRLSILPQIFGKNFNRIVKNGTDTIYGSNGY